MGFLTRQALRLHSLARFIEQPRLLPLRLRRTPIDAYLRFAQPWLRDLGIATVLDIGANVGDFALIAHAALPQARILAFEPLPDCFAQLQARMRAARRFQAFNLAIGDQSGTLQFERSSFAESSSFLQMAETHRRLFPYSRDTQPVSVRVECLDTITAGMRLAEPILVKIDVQGYEDHVLRGGARTLRRARVVVIETSFELLYEGQPLFDDLYRTLTGWGFQYRGALDRLASPADGRTLQENSLFVRDGP